MKAKWIQLLSQIRVIFFFSPLVIGWQRNPSLCPQRSALSPFLGMDKFMKTGFLNLQELQINSDWGELIPAQVGTFVKWALIMNAWAGLQFTWCLEKQRHLVHLRRHNTFRWHVVVRPKKGDFLTFHFFIFILVTEDWCSSPVDTVKNDGRASSSKAKAKKGKLSVASKPEPKAATVRRKQHCFLYIIWGFLYSSCVISLCETFLRM